MGNTLRFTMDEWRMLFPRQGEPNILSKHDRQCAVDWQIEAENTYRRIMEAREKLAAVANDSALKKEFEEHIIRLMNLADHAAKRSRTIMGLE